MGQEPHLNTAAQKALDAAQERGGLVIMGNEGVANEFSSRACDFFDRFVFSAGLPDDFSILIKTVILRACDFFDLFVFSAHVTGRFQPPRNRHPGQLHLQKATEKTGRIPVRKG
jgi:hypothetical protein